MVDFRQHRQLRIAPCPVLLISEAVLYSWVMEARGWHSWRASLVWPHFTSLSETFVLPSGASLSSPVSSGASVPPGAQPVSPSHLSQHPARWLLPPAEPPHQSCSPPTPSHLLSSVGAMINQENRWAYICAVLCPSAILHVKRFTEGTVA